MAAKSTRIPVPKLHSRIVRAGDEQHSAKPKDYNATIASRKPSGDMPIQKRPAVSFPILEYGHLIIKVWKTNAGQIALLKKSSLITNNMISTALLL